MVAFAVLWVSVVTLSFLYFGFYHPRMTEAPDLPTTLSERTEQTDPLATPAEIIIPTALQPRPTPST